MANTTAGLTASWSDIWLLDGVRTPFADYSGALAGVSPTDLGIKAAREVFAHAGVAPQNVGAVICRIVIQEEYRHRNGDSAKAPQKIGNQRAAVVQQHQDVSHDSLPGNQSTSAAR